MPHITFWRRAAAALFACGLAALLSACLISPGRFVSSLDIHKDGRFTFTYNGEIHMLALSKLAEDAKDEEFTERPCMDEETSEPRPCSRAEKAGQRKEWEDGREERMAKRKGEAEQMRAFLGGIDPMDPKAGEALAERLRRQTGWKRVDYKGDGLFVVDVAITSRLDHDFTFPTIERFPNMSPFVQMALRNDGTLRIDAPAFVRSANDPFRMMAMGKTEARSSEDGSSPNFPELSGTFTVTSDAAILANNTDEGPQAVAGGQRLHWKIGALGQAAPMALIQLER